MVHRWGSDIRASLRVFYRYALLVDWLGCWSVVYGTREFGAFTETSQPKLRRVVEELYCHGKPYSAAISAPHTTWTNTECRKLCRQKSHRPNSVQQCCSLLCCLHCNFCERVISPYQSNEPVQTTLFAYMDEAFVVQALMNSRPRRLRCFDLSRILG